MNHRSDIVWRVVGRIRTPFGEASGTPIQPAYAHGAEGQIIVDEAYAAALDDIEGFERIWLLFWLDRAGAYRLRVVPYRDTRERGLFATRAPSRPNPIGLSCVRLIRREGNILHIADVDMLDNTPLLDIKPYLPEIDAHPTSRAGWFERSSVNRHLADGRFAVCKEEKRAAAGEKQAGEGDRLLADGAMTGRCGEGSVQGIAKASRGTVNPGCSFEMVSDESLVLTPGEVCIQTAARQAHREVTLALLEGSSEGAPLEIYLDLLERFLATTDFARLRTEHPELAGGTRYRVRLFRCNDGSIRWEMVGSEREDTA